MYFSWKQFQNETLILFFQYVAWMLALQTIKGPLQVLVGKKFQPGRRLHSRQRVETGLQRSHPIKAHLHKIGAKWGV
jgi:hypothetical protein